MSRKELPILKQRKPTYDCSRCPGYCCSYDWILVGKRDIKRLAKRFNVTYEVAEKRYTKYVPEYGRRVMRHRHDHIFKSTCMFFDQVFRRCRIYEHRPATCRDYPVTKRCGYYDFLQWERTQQDDEEFVPLVS